VGAFTLCSWYFSFNFVDVDILFLNCFISKNVCSTSLSGSGAHPASYPMGTGGSFPGDKAAGT
jgi:hypothetical protein